jgi:hypothetical protein
MDFIASFLVYLILAELIFLIIVTITIIIMIAIDHFKKNEKDI